MLLAGHHQEPGARIYNIGTDEVTTVDWSVRAISEHLGIEPEIVHTGGERGWIGDSPLIHLDCSRMRALGWKASHTIAQAVDRTLHWFDDNEWVFDPR
jgi:UDP-glucose 4-epimerase